VAGGDISKIPFTVYDFFAYLFSGSVLVAAVDYLYSYQWLVQDKPKAVFIIFLLGLAYVTGHLVAHFSSLLLEQLLVDKVLKRPSRTLMGEPPPPFLRRIFPGYYSPLPQKTQERVKSQSEKRGFEGSGESLFLHAYPVVKADERVQRRLDKFHNLYGFARNMALAFMAAAALLAWYKWVGDRPLNSSWIILSTGLGIGMLYRYLKFFRQYSYEVLITYAEMPSPEIKET